MAIADQWQIPKDEQDSGDGLPPTDIEKVQYINFLKRGIANADIVTTVSEQYARELLMPKTSHSLLFECWRTRRTHLFLGVRNGVDYSWYWNPMFDEKLPVNYDIEIVHRKYDNKRALQHRLGLPIDDTIPIIGMNSRITEQRLFLGTGDLCRAHEATRQLVVVGAGQGEYARFLTAKMRQFPSWRSAVDKLR